MLEALRQVLIKTDAHIEQQKIEPQALLKARLFPDMLDFSRQIQVATDFAKSVSARLAGIEIPKFEDDEKTLDELIIRIDRVLKFIATIDEISLSMSGDKEIITQGGTPKEKRFSGHTYLFHYGLPHFFFHITTAYAILRHNGVPIGKKDFIGTF